MINISEKLPKNLMTILRKFRNEKSPVKSQILITNIAKKVAAPIKKL